MALATPWNCMLGNILFYLEYLNSHKSRDDILLGSCAWSIWSSKELTCALHFPIKGQATTAGQVKILLQAKSYTLRWKPRSYLMGREILHSWYWQVLYHRKKLCIPFRALHILIPPQDSSITNSWTSSEPIPLLLSQQVAVPNRPLNTAPGQGSKISSFIARLSSEEVGIHPGPEITRVIITHRW